MRQHNLYMVVSCGGCGPFGPVERVLKSFRINVLLYGLCDVFFSADSNQQRLS